MNLLLIINGCPEKAYQAGHQKWKESNKYYPLKKYIALQKDVKSCIGYLQI